MEPSILDDICACVGYTATRTIATWYPGRNLYVPTVAKHDHPLVLLIGLQALKQLVATFSGEQVTIPPLSHDRRFARDRRIAVALVAGQTCSEIAEQENLTPRRVEQIRAELIDRRWLEYAARGRVHPGAVGF